MAESGAQAWSLLRQLGSPKLVILDWVLPGMDGIDLCQKIRQGGTPHSYIYVIMLTGKDGKQNMLKAMQAGVDDYLEKTV